MRFVNDGPDLSRLLDEDDTISNAVRRAIAAVYIRASEDKFGQPIFAAHGLSNLVLHMLSDGTATFWLVSESAAKTQDNLENSLLLCMSSANDSNHPFASSLVCGTSTCVVTRPYRASSAKCPSWHCVPCPGP